MSFFPREEKNPNLHRRALVESRSYLSCPDFFSGFKTEEIVRVLIASRERLDFLFFDSGFIALLSHWDIMCDEAQRS